MTAAHARVPDGRRRSRSRIITPARGPFARAALCTAHPTPKNRCATSGRSATPTGCRSCRNCGRGRRSVGELCRALGSPIANVSHHLKTLKDADIVSARRKGRFIIYQLKHLVETPRPGDAPAGLRLLPRGVRRGPGRDARRRPPRIDEQALHVLNSILGSKPAECAKAARASAGRDGPTRPPASEAGHIEIANASFERPAAPFFDTHVEGWVKEGDPAGTGVFRNFPDDTPFPGSRRVVNADGEQLATVGAGSPGGATGRPGLFQSLTGVTYQPGARYVLSVGVGVSSVQPPTGGGGGARRPRCALR